jgi:hypothetical protein
VPELVRLEEVPQHWVVAQCRPAEQLAALLLGVLMPLVEQ